MRKAPFCIHKLAPYKTIYLSITSLTTPLSKIRLRQVVDIGEANPTLSKNFKSNYFLMPKHVPNVVAITRYRTPTHNLRAIQIHSSTNYQPYNAFIKNPASTSCRYQRGEPDATKKFQIRLLFDAKTCT